MEPAEESPAAQVGRLARAQVRKWRRLPGPHQPFLEEITIRVVAKPFAKSNGQPEDDDRYGEFFGVPLCFSAPSAEGGGQPEIVLFANALVRDFGRGAELEEQVRITLLHELAHAMGEDEDQVAARGLA